jgi:glucokinase
VKIAAGIDIGGTNTAFGLVDENGKIIFRDSLDTKKYPHPEELAKATSELILKSISNFESRISNFEFVGTGIGAPNGNYFNGTIEFAPNLNWKGVIPLAYYFEKYSEVKAILTNDANAAAMGEMIFGGAKGMKDFLFITLGTGLGSGIVVNGEMVYGHDGFAGELGHIIVERKGRYCGCGRQGCLETYCSATGIVKTYAELKVESLSKEGRLSMLSLGEEITAKTIYKRAQLGESEALESFRKTGEILGTALANAVAITSPEAIFLFGGLAQAGDFIFKPTAKYFEENLLNIYKNKVKILPSLLNENDAAILGAASLVFK